MVARIFGSSALIDYSSTKVMKYLGRNTRDVLHFACHGLFDRADPLSSGILLADNKLLTPRDILNIRLNSEIVALSACETGVNENKPRDELFGLTRAFLYAGAGSIGVSLWPVDDLAAYTFMIEFYEQMKSIASNHKSRKALALQRAQWKLMKNSKYSNLDFWAPFILVGKWT